MARRMCENVPGYENRPPHGDRSVVDDTGLEDVNPTHCKRSCPLDKKTDHLTVIGLWWTIQDSNL